jgi:hypothetical protein
MEPVIECPLPECAGGRRDIVASRAATFRSWPQPACVFQRVNFTPDKIGRNPDPPGESMRRIIARSGGAGLHGQKRLEEVSAPATSRPA